jgi:hypothetical protein
LFELEVNAFCDIGVLTDVPEAVDFAISGALDGEVDVDIFSQREFKLKEHGDFFVGKVILTLLNSGIPQETIRRVLLQIINELVFRRRNIKLIPVKQSNRVPAIGTKALCSDRCCEFQVKLKR